MYEKVQLINASAYRPLSAFKIWEITAVLRHDKSSAARLYPLLTMHCLSKRILLVLRTSLISYVLNANSGRQDDTLTH